MLKIVFCTILLALVAPVMAGSFMTHEKFVHLSYQEQKKVVLSVMELVVEMEEKYQHEVKTSGFNSERFRRYTEFLRKVSHLLFPEAHAARNVRYGQYLNQLRTLVREQNKCIYAGWISVMNRDNKCTHPSNSANSLRSLYQQESGCAGVNQISCNPAIFGFKNVSQKTLFCVPAGVGVSDNSSRDCMVKALMNPPEQGASSVEERINNMIAGIAANPNDANAVFDFLLEACACDPARSPQINSYYASRIRPHQTCYAILRMMSEFTPRCSVASQPMDQNQLQFLSSIRSMLTDAQIRTNEDPANPNGENVRTLYVAGIENLRRENTDFRNSEIAICGAGPDSTGGGNGNNGTQGCNQETERTPDNRLCCRGSRVPKADGSGCEDAPQGGTSGSLTIGGDSGGANPDNTGGTSGTPNNGGGVDGTPNNNGGNSTPSDVDTIVVTGRRCNTETHEWVGPDETMECLPKCAEGTVRNETTRACDSSPQTETQTCTAPNEEPDPSGTGCRCVGGGTRSEDNSCPEQPASSGISISVTSTNKSDNSTSTIAVTVNPSDYPRDEYTILWFRRGYTETSTTRRTTSRFTPRSDESVAPTPEGDDQPSGDSGDDPAPNASREPGENETVMEGKDDVTTMEVPRAQGQDYQVCARLIKKSDNSLADDECATVQKKPDAPVAPAGNRRNSGGMMNPFQQPQMMPSRGGSSDAIFRGVR